MFQVFSQKMKVSTSSRKRSYAGPPPGVPKRSFAAGPASLTVRRARRSEVKNFTATPYDQVIITTGGTIVPLNNVTLGDSGAQRDGRIVRSLSLRLRCVLQNLVGVPGFTARLIVFRWDDTNFPVVSDILQFVGANQIVSQINWGSTTRMKVLYDKMIDVNSGTGLSTTAVGIAHKSFVKDIKLYGNAEWYTPTGQARGAVYSLLLCDTAAAGSAYMQTQYLFTEV